MPKRKREEGESDAVSSIEDRAVRIKASRLQARVEHSVTVLANALKLAKAFDRQKMSRRQKQAGADQQKGQRLKEEIEVLKVLEPSKTARNYLMKQMVKTKRIARSEGFVARYGSDVKVAPSKGVAEANVLGRLFKSNPVQEVLPGVMKGIYDVLALSETADDSAKLALKNGQSGGRASKPQNSQGDTTINTAGANADDSESENEDLIKDYEMYKSRLAGSSSPESDLDVDARQTGENDVQDDMEITSEDEPLGSDDENSDLGDISLSDEDNETVLKPPPKPTPALAPEKKSTSTAFLPSLSMGGYYSGSENESDVDANYDPDAAFEAAQPQPRKNRRGQRERQKIAEKKYGAGANHLKKQGPQDAKNGRNAGWDMRRGAVDSQHGRGNRVGERAGVRARFEPTGANADAVKPRNDVKAKSKPVTQAMHPSWEAARKKKLESQAGGASFAGKKITFD